MTIDSVIKLTMASVIKLILGSIAFVIFWMLAVFPAVPFLPIGRTAGSLFGGMLMVIFQLLTADEAYDAIDLSILGLLFGTMVVSGYLERAGGFNHLGKLLSWKSQGAKDLICRICIISAISSALFTNDTSCIVLTEYVLKIAMQNNLPPHPLLLALATSANIGSSATPIGNPQNLVIATESGISFGGFVAGILPSAVLGIIVNALLLLCMYWDELSIQKDEENSSEDFGAEESVNSHQFSPATMSHLASTYSRGLTSPRYETESQVSHYVTLINDVGSSESEIRSVENVIWGSRNSNTFERWKKKMWKYSVYAVIVGMLVALLMGLNMSWTSITAALALMVLDFKDAMPCLEKVSYPLLIFFCGMFITVEGFNKTGIPNTLWELVEPYARIDEAIGVAILGFIILILSNVISNVPTVLLLGSRIVESAATIDSAYVKKAWLMLAWSSTVAGNLSLVGSAANLIVCEQARRVPHQGYTLTLWNHLRFGVPSTLIVIAIGLPLIYYNY